MADVSKVALADIRHDGGCQPRSIIDLNVVSDYAEAMLLGAQFPPVTVFYDGESYWLADGFHRAAAAEGAGLTEIAADIRQGTRRDAVLFSCGANAAHGLRRSNEDKRRAVMTLLNDAEWSHWSDREIARRCGVSAEMVHKMRPAICQPLADKTVSRNGSIYTMNTAGLGRRPAARDDDAPVFDNTSCGEAEPEPPRTADGRIVIDGRDLRARAGTWDSSGSEIYHAIKDAVREIETLPSPEEAVARFNKDLGHSLRAAKVRACAEWLLRFSELWAAGEPERDARAARMLERVKEMDKTHVIKSR